MGGIIIQATQKTPCGHLYDIHKVFLFTFSYLFPVLANLFKILYGILSLRAF